MRPRNAELSLLILGLIITFATYALVDLARDAALSPEAAGFIAIFSALALAGHWAIRKLAPTADPLLFSIAVLLAGFGYGIIRRLAPDLATAQLGWFAISIGALILTLWLVRDHRILEQFRYSFMAIGIILLLLPLAPGIGTDLGRDAKLWVDLGPMNFQPAELAKVVLAIFLAGYLASKREVMTMTTTRIGPIAIPAPRHFGPLIMAWGLSLAVMFYERDLGSSLLFFSLFLVTIYAATGRAVFPVLGIGLFGLGVRFAYTTFSHVRIRFGAWLHPFGDEPETGFAHAGRQIAHSYMAFGTGGFTGVGLGLGRPDLIDPGLRSGTLPTDFIFAAIGEELGLLGSTAVLLLFGLIIARGLHIALRSRDQFGTLLATGLTAIVGVQALLIMAGVTRLIPLTGITLPFVSYGGSSLLANFVLLALLIRISDGEAVE